MVRGKPSSKMDGLENKKKKKEKSEKKKSDRRKHTKQKQVSGMSRTKVGTENDIFKPSKIHTRVPKRTVLQRVASQLNFGIKEVELGGKAQEAADLLQLTKYEISYLKYKFDLYDVDKSGEIEYGEFLLMINEENTELTDALFAIVDSDGKGTIDFDEFVQVLATYCIFSRDDILRFVFDTFDKDGSGALDEKEFMDLCVAINKNGPIFPGNFKRALERFDKNGDGLIDFGEFVNLNLRYPMINYPAFRLQDKMQKATLGEKKWVEILKNKAKREYIEEYKRKHHGALPPEPFCTKLRGRIFGTRTKATYDMDD